MIFIASVDAGGAEILTAFLKTKFVDTPLSGNVEGPALDIFNRKSINVSYLQSVPEYSPGDILYTTLSWSSELERACLKKAINCGATAIVFLEHWANYRSRLTYENVILDPSQIWVFDRYAKEFCEKELPEISSQKIKIKPNYYLIELEKEFSTLEENRRSTYDLFLSEPVSKHALKKYGDEQYLGYTEYKALKYLLNKLGHLRKNRRLKIRLHPSEDASKYSFLLNNNNDVEISDTKDLAEDLYFSGNVFGCETMAMVIALNFGKSVYSVIPPGGRACILPHNEILKASDYV